MKKMILCCAILFSGFSFAKSLSAPVLRYFHHRLQIRSERTPLQTLLGDLTPPEGVKTLATNCTTPAGPSCVSIACNEGGLDCKFASDLNELIPLCRNVDGACVQDICGQGGLNCHFASDLKSALSLCLGVNGDCVDVTCAQGGYNCHFESDLNSVAQKCGTGVDPACIRDTCAQGGLNCHFSSDLDKVLDLCKP